MVDIQLAENMNPKLLYLALLDKLLQVLHEFLLYSRTEQSTYTAA
jgi:hypothetical protein